MRGNRRGFSLIEILVASALVSIFISSLILLLSTGLQIWKRMGTRDRADLKTRISLERFNRDVRNMVPFKAIPVQAGAERFVFPSLMTGPEGVQEIGSVSYYMNDSRNGLCRTAQSYRNSAQRAPACEEVVKGVNALHFEYGILDEGGEFLWQKEVEEDDRLIAVALKMELKDSSRKEIQKTVYVPAYKKDEA